MPASISTAELAAYSDGERARWERWFQLHPDALAAPVQTGGRFASVWDLIDHIFLVEKRHTLRLKGVEPLPTATGASPPQAAALFAWGRDARAELAAVLAAMTPAEAESVMRVRFGDREYAFTRRKLALHIFFHETRHWAQIATAVRNAGFEPPGNHDLIYSTALP